MGWWIAAAILLLIILALQCSLTLKLKYTDNKLDFRVTYIFFTLYPFKKKKKRKKSSKEETSTESSEPTPLPETEVETTEQPGKKPTKSKRSLAEIIEIAKSVKEKLGIVYGSSSKGLRRIMRHIIVDDVMVDFTVRGADAAKTAVQYGIISGVVYGIIAILSSLTTLYINSCDIDCDFDGEESDITVKLKVKIRVSTLLTSGLLIGTHLLRRRKELFAKPTPVIQEGI
jgi:hypothetical protein